MFRHNFFTSVVGHIDQWAGNLFYRGIQPSEIDQMPYGELKYWNEWHELIAKKEKGNA